MLPFHPVSAAATASRLGGSRLLVGSSSNSRLLRPTINIARASLVFSPPESVPLGWNTFSPLRPIMPRNARSWVSV